LHIDIPVKLSEAKEVYSVGALAFEGDLPASIFHLQLISNDGADWNAKTEVIAIFHTNAGHATLHDSAYNADRNIATDNPYKILLADLMTRGVQVEGALGKRRLAPGVKVNTDAMARTTQLVQQGFVEGLNPAGRTPFGSDTPS
ncbi:MAG TPA: hypothetical protein VNZ53_40945, partial [Steroidobacteraceae bacterium]|nr:hypothetical protein [Steroidobacteraceae bacterium]